MHALSRQLFMHTTAQLSAAASYCYMSDGRMLGASRAAAPSYDSERSRVMQQGSKGWWAERVLWRLHGIGSTY
jgi:hypothetical protein